MKDRRQILAIAAASAVAALSLPAVAAAEYYVPPANSAANQYTESFPGAGGESSGKGKKVTPGAALGAGNAEKLEKKGSAGKATAELAAETAPPQLVDQGSNGGEGTGEADDNGQTGGKSSEGGEDESGSGVPATGGGGSNGGSSGSRGGTGAEANVQQPQGSSGVGKVLGQATGVSDGDLGLWLPLVIVLTLIGSVAYWARARNAQPGHRA
ncbi:MAG TPA: hypothetical protein VFS54_02120 [Solirubrobacterales bacterium]|nr:hypothetical protein [Solirubrobacterales bacterium]